MATRISHEVDILIFDSIDLAIKLRANIINGRGSSIAPGRCLFVAKLGWWQRCKNNQVFANPLIFNAGAAPNREITIVNIPHSTVSDDDNFLIPLVEIHIKTTTVYRASESVADLRNVAEILYHPFKTVGFWDQSSGEHLCPYTQHAPCQHKRNEAGKQAYRKTVVDELDGLLEVWFPEAGLSLFLN